DTNFFINKLINNKKIIWANTHGSTLAEKASLIIPTLTFLETKFSYFSSEGLFQKTQKIVNCVGTKLSLINLYKHIFFENKRNFYNFFINKKIIKQFDTLKMLLYININSITMYKQNQLILTNYPIKSNLEDF